MTSTTPKPHRWFSCGTIVAIAAVWFAAVIAVGFWQLERTQEKRVAVVGDERFLREVYQALLQPLFQSGAFPSSLDAPELQAFLRERHIVFEPERRLTYYPPSGDATKQTVLITMETPRGQFLLRYDGKVESPIPREKRTCDEAFFSIINHDRDLRHRVVSITVMRSGSASKTFEAAEIQRVSAFLSGHHLVGPEKVFRWFGRFDRRRR